MFHTVRRRHGSWGFRSLALLGACAAVGALPLGGCETDSFLDPSVTGRWEHTPTVVPILERIAAIEDSSGDLVEYSDVTPADLIPDPGEYRIGPGDQLMITLYDDIDNRGLPSVYERIVDIRGNVDLPQLGQISLSNRTVEQARGVLEDALSRFVNEPLVAIVVTAQRQQTFNVMGIVEQPGPYFISKPDYRLLEALTASGRFPETTEEIYIIRQIPLSDAVRGIVPPSGAAPGTPDAQTPAGPAQAPPEPPKDGAKLIDLIDQLSQPKGDSQPAEPPKDPATPAVDPKRPSPSVMREGALAPGRSPRRQPPTEQAPPSQPDRPPAVDLVQPGATPANGSPTGPDGRKAAPGSSWVFVHGEWVQIKDPAGAARPARPERTARGTTPAPSGAEQLMTQRVIRVPVKPLIAGLSQYNIVVRPGDVIHVPAPPQGFVYMTGQIVRPGPYNLPEVGRMTLTRAVAAAGGLSAIAIPERVDLTRVVGKNKQAIIRLDYRAIAEGTMPDVYMRPDDVVNVGTNFWAYPLAVLRNGVRTSYGFGFVVDRNFDQEIFGTYNQFGN